MAKKMRLPILFLLALLVQLAAFCCVSAQEYFYDGAWHPYSGNEFQLRVNGELLQTSMPPIVFEEYSVVPAREVFEYLGAQVDWDGENAVVKIVYESRTMLLRINSTEAQVGNTRVTMPIAPKIINEKTMVPVRFVAEQMGLSVDFDSDTDTVLIERPAKSGSVTSVRWDLHRAGTAGFVTVATDMDEVEYEAFVMDDPSRIVLDIFGTVNRSGKSSVAVDERNVEQIRIGQHEDSTRIVVDLTENAGYQVEAAGSEVVITVRLAEEEGGTDEAKPSEAPSAKPPVSETNQTDPPEGEETEPPVPPVELSRYVTIDVGHGGQDPGTIYRDESGEVVAQEKEINLGVALKVQKKLEAAGVRVHMIRTTDTYVDYQKVGSIANEKGTTLFVSIHTNSATPEEASGIEAWGYLSGGANYAGMTSAKLSKNILDELIQATGAKNRGVKDGQELAVIHTTNMPATLVEVGFITNQEEREKLMSDSYREKLADAITAGILKSLAEMGL